MTEEPEKTYIDDNTFNDETVKDIVRSKACFSHIFYTAGYEAVYAKPWFATKASVPVYTAVLKLVAEKSQAKSKPHKDCVGEKFRQRWNQEQEQ